MPPPPVTWDGTDADGQPLRWDTPGITGNDFLPAPRLQVVLRTGSSRGPKARPHASPGATP